MVPAAYPKLPQGCGSGVPNMGLVIFMQVLATKCTNCNSAALEDRRWARNNATLQRGAIG
ncbi:hypothetical protein HaLaN_24359 [Haematococcus lacustris]|uniref:Uncharacterized protein n=1 Tax=Haematococcus lacustris TaxID=44745 RepID=A0A699ZU66_HAELA|nr:hypothetical protein HaLaN_24359 [Haematococcus lacustris]